MLNSLMLLEGLMLVKFTMSTEKLKMKMGKNQMICVLRVLK